MSAPKLTLPPIRLADLPEQTKDFILALCNQEHCTPEEALRKTLDLAAARAGFPIAPTKTEDARRETALAA